MRAPITRRECLGALAAAALGPRAARGADRRPNILLILIDTLRADHVGCYGYPRPTTPRIDRLAAEGVRFAAMRTASPWTMPSVMTLFTSLPPAVHGATSYQRRASLRVTTLAERLKRLGYRRTAAIVSNPTVNARYGFAQGFDLYDDYSVFFAHELDLFDAEAAPKRKSVAEAVTSRTVTDMAAEWLEREGSHAPWFLFLLYFDPHYQYVPPEPWDRRFDPHPDAANRSRERPGRRVLRAGAPPEDIEHALALYDGEIGFADRHVGRLLDRLDAMGHREDTLVALTSDHGEEFLDHGGALHGRTLFDELTRGVLVLRQPGRLPAGRVVPAPACHLDLAPTLLDLVGAAPDPACWGRSLVPLLRGGGGARPLFLGGTTPRQEEGVVLGPHKLVRDLATGRERLHHLDADPGERSDVAAREPALRRRLAAALDDHIAACAAAAKTYNVGGAPSRPALTRRDIENLRQLGYLQ